MQTNLPSRGFGDTIAKITSWMGIEPCGGCEKRRKTLNRWLAYKNADLAPALQVPSTELFVPAAQPIVSSKLELFRSLPPILASSGGWREPGRRAGPLDWEGDRRSPGSNPAPAPGGFGAPATFACGIDVTDATKIAITTTRSEFGRLTDEKKHEACDALRSLRTGAFAWDIIDLRLQVTDDLLNKLYRPPCATSGATPACGSSVAVDGSCHFAGSANYVIFGVMCKLCEDHYQKMLNNASWFEVLDQGTCRLLLSRFSKPGMLGLIDLYKKYVPLLQRHSPAGNIEAAKRWSIAGYDGWPTTAATPPADRGNCEVVCPHTATGTFSVSWYPFLNPYSG